MRCLPLQTVWKDDPGGQTVVGGIPLRDGGACYLEAMAGTWGMTAVPWQEGLVSPWVPGPAPSPAGTVSLKRSFPSPFRGYSMYSCSRRLGPSFSGLSAFFLTPLDGDCSFTGRDGWG